MYDRNIGKILGYTHLKKPSQKVCLSIFGNLKTFSHVSSSELIFPLMCFSVPKIQWPQFKTGPTQPETTFQ